MNAVLLAGAVLAALLGSACLALSQRRHWHTVTGQAVTPVLALRRSGWSMLAASFLLTILRDGLSFGALMWPMLTGASALVTALLLTWAPRRVHPLARIFIAKKP